MNCLRCGRRIAEGRTFCDECEKITGVPLEENAYLSSRVVLNPPRADAERSKAEPTPAQTKSAEIKRQLRTLKRACAIMTVACLLFALLCCALTWLLLRDGANHQPTGPRIDPSLGSESTQPDNDNTSGSFTEEANT